MNDYRLRHTAPRNADGNTPIWDLEFLARDVYEHPEWFRDGHEWDKANEALLLPLKDEPDRPVVIYRSVPLGVSQIHPGDWVTLCREYAELSGLQDNVPTHVLSLTVPARHVWWDGNSLYEFGYDPREDIE